MSEFSAQSSRAFVSLVGAGPGDPGLITVKGARLLEQADVVVYDALANPRLLSYCPRAEIVYVGKRAAHHSMTQIDINALLVAKAREGEHGKRVVRLKGGDPFIFGRGGEECEALAAAGIRFEVVPGITAAIAAPAYAGIPVTHRDFNSSFTLITGHEKEEEFRDDEAKRRDKASGSSDIDWAAVAKLPCVAFYMGIKALPRITSKLIEHGMSPQTPVATIQWGTHAKQRTVVATVGTIVDTVQREKIGAPAITIVGEVVKMRESINWFESRPLFGQTVVVTRTRQQASDLSERLEALGANVIEAPTIEITPPGDWEAVDDALRRSAVFDWIVFTSANGVIHTKQRLLDVNLDTRHFGGIRFAAIGDPTSRAVKEQFGIRVDLCPKSFVAEALAEELISRGEVGGKRFLLLRADIARPILREKLIEAGAAEVADVAVYETRTVDALPPDLIEALRDKSVNWITFTSSSTVRNFFQLLGSDAASLVEGVRIASIGPITTKTLQALGHEPAVQAETFNVEGLIAALSGAIK